MTREIWTTERLVELAKTLDADAASRAFEQSARLEVAFDVRRGLDGRWIIEIHPGSDYHQGSMTREPFKTEGEAVQHLRMRSAETFLVLYTAYASDNAEAAAKARVDAELGPAGVAPGPWGKCSGYAAKQEGDVG